MKNIKFFVLLLLLTILSTACTSTKFDGSRTGNKNQLIMDYKMLNTTDSQMLELEQGDILTFEIDSKAGCVNIILQKDEEKPIYEGTDIPTSTFQVEINDSGAYKVSITGEKAKGSVSVIKSENN